MCALQPFLLDEVDISFLEMYLTFFFTIDFRSQLKDDFLSATATSCPLIESLVLMSCPSVGPDGLTSLRCLASLTYLDLSYTFLVNLQPVFDSCLYLKVFYCKFVLTPDFHRLRYLAT